MNAALQKLLSWLRSTWRRARLPERGDTVIVPPAPPPAIALPSPLLACATVVIPALNEAARVADVVRHALADPATAEVIVVDDSSIDDTARLAQQAGARVLRSSDGWTPLHLAAFFGRDEAVSLLIDHGAPLDAHSTNATRNTPLHAALAGATKASVVRRLILAGADVEARGAQNITPLHLAASRGDIALCDLLVARGADPQAVMEDGTTPSMLAATRGFTGLGEHLAMQERVDQE